MTPKEFTEAVKAKKKVFGTLVASTSPKWAAEIKKTGIDFVFIDTEHIPIDRNELSWMCQAYAGMGIAPLVRIPSPDPYAACMALDAGACGVMAPYIETVEQVRALRGAVKLRPLKGKLLNDVLDGKKELSPEAAAFIEINNAEKLLFINIESVYGVENMENLLAVPGVDAVIIGPHDLSVNMGIPEQWKNPEYDAMIKRIVDKAHAMGVAAGNHYSFGLDDEIEWLKYGMDITIHSTDISAFVRMIGSEIRTLREAAGSDGAIPESNDVPAI